MYTHIYINIRRVKYSRSAARTCSWLSNVTKKKKKKRKPSYRESRFLRYLGKPGRSLVDSRIDRRAWSDALLGHGGTNSAIIVEVRWLVVTHASAQAKNAIRSSKSKLSTPITLTSLTIFAIRMKVITATWTAETYNSPITRTIMPFLFFPVFSTFDTTRSLMRPVNQKL